MIEKLKELIGDMSQRGFSQKYGIPLRTLEEWLAGRRTPPSYVIDLLAKVIEYEKFLYR